MDKLTLWNNIEWRLDAEVPSWRERVDRFGQLAAVEKRLAGGPWSDAEVLEGLLMAVLSSEMEWSKIEGIQEDLRGLFHGFRLDWYAARSPAEISDRFVPWFKDRKASSRNRERDLANLVRAAQILLEHSKGHGTADSYFTSLLEICDGDPKQAALRLGRPGDDYKLPSLGVPLAAEALKNLGFDVAKPDRHIMRAIGSFQLVHFSGWSNAKDGREGRAAPTSTSKKLLLAAMAAVQEIAEVASKPVVLVDNAIWILCAESGLHLSNQELAEIAHKEVSPEDQAVGLGSLIRSWTEDEDAE